MARRKTEVFSMSFLDCITCAFGSVVLVYVLINAHGGLRHLAETRAAHAEVSKLEEQVLEGYQELVVLRNSIRWIRRWVGSSMTKPNYESTPFLLRRSRIPSAPNSWRRHCAIRPPLQHRR